MISNLHKNKRYNMIAKNLEVPVSDSDISGSSFASIEYIAFKDKAYSRRSTLPNSIREQRTTTSRLSHLSAKEPELDEKSIQELLELVRSA